MATKVAIIDYSKFGIVVRTQSPMEAEMEAAHGMFNQFLKRGDTKAPGWLFSKKREKEAKVLAAKFNLEVVEYTEKSIALFGEPEPHVKALIQNKSVYNPRLKDENERPFGGWLFSKKAEQTVKTLCAAF